MTDRRAVFIDKDGTLVEDVPYNVDPARVRLVRGAGDALARLQVAGFDLVVVSNQSGVARGYFDESALAAVEARVRELLRPSGVTLSGFYYCPHPPDGKRPEYAVACECRKPGPGMLLRARHDLGLELAASWMVGDILDDIEAGRRAGCRAILIDNGNETEWLPGAFRTPDYRAPGLAQAATLILAAEPLRRPAAVAAGGAS